MRGRCLAYGDGITYWPVVEVVKQMAALPSDVQAAEARSGRCSARATRCRAPTRSPGRSGSCSRNRRRSSSASTTSSGAEETFLDLVESTALLSTGAPLLLVCMARPEFARPPSRLAGDAAAGAAAGRGGERARRRRRVGRGPAADRPRLRRQSALPDGDGRPQQPEGGEVEVPPTLRALLAARLDQLDEPSGGCSSAERWRASCSTEAPSRRSRLRKRRSCHGWRALVRRELVRPDRPQLPHDDGYRFRHLLIRDAAYDALPKAVRADLHGRFAAWLEEHGESLVERTRSSVTTSNRPAGTERSSGSQTPPWPTAPPRDSLPPAIARSTAGNTGTAPHC